jgi:predicted permease
VTAALAHIINTLTPVFTAVLAGYLLSRTGFLSKGFLDELNKFVFWVALPAAILASLAPLGGFPPGVFGQLGVFTMATLLLVACCYAALRMLDFEAWRRGTFVQAAFRGNLAFIAIPVLGYVFRGRPDEEARELLGAAVFLFAPTMALYNVLAVLMLARGNPANHGGPAIIGSLRAISKNPLIVASAAGMIIALGPLRLPGALIDSLDYLGRISGPAALLCVGGAIATSPVRHTMRPALAAALLKVWVLPLLVFLCALPFDFGRDELLMLMVFAASPSAVAGYVMARAMGGDAPLASAAVVWSTLLSLAALAVVVGAFAN